MWTQISLEDGLSRMERGVSKAMLILDGIPTNKLFTNEELMAYYDCVYSMCVQHPPFDYSVELYKVYQKALEVSISSKVLPSLVNKDGTNLLVELCDMWSNYSSMTRCLRTFFLYLDRHYTNGRSAESLKDMSLRYFRDLVPGEVYQRSLNAAINVINQDREVSVDKNLLRKVSSFFVEIGGKGNTCYYDSFERAVLENAANYYHHLASQLFVCNSSADYFHKAQWCLNQEKERAGQYLHEKSVNKLLEAVHWQLLGQTESMLTEKQKAEGCHHGSITYEELLQGCANLSLGQRS